LLLEKLCKLAGIQIPSRRYSQGWTSVTVSGINDLPWWCLNMHGRYIMQTTPWTTACRRLSNSQFWRNEAMINSWPRTGLMWTVNKVLPCGQQIKKNALTLQVLKDTGQRLTICSTSARRTKSGTVRTVSVLEWMNEWFYGWRRG
jgi:hypothetical protein